MGSLKDSLEKAGFRATKPIPEKKEKKASYQPKKKMHTHQGHRNFCEVCNRTFPDVECYNHTLPNVKAKWICVQCADRLGIPDNCRETKQSEYARKGIFRREYGRTKRYFDKKTESTNEEKKRPNSSKNKNFHDNQKSSRSKRQKPGHHHKNK